MKTYEEQHYVDLGAIAKVYIADKIKELLLNEGVTSAIINLGGNVLCVGDKSSIEIEGNDYFHIGIQKPFADRNEIIQLWTLRINQWFPLVFMKDHLL